MSAGRIPRQMVRRDFLKMSAVLPVALLVPNTPGHVYDGTLPPEVTDATTRRAYEEIGRWADWLKANGVRGYFGETGWPNALDGHADAAQWQALGEKVYGWLDEHNLWATYWTASLTSTSIWSGYSPSNFSGSYESRVYGTANSQAEVVERHPTYPTRGGTVWRGVNVNGGELHMGMSDFSNRNPGSFGRQYVYPSRAALQYLVDRGHKLIRFPFRWERVQPVLGGELSTPEMGRIKRFLDDCAALGLKVIPDCHNYAAYQLPSGDLRIGTPEVPVEAFANLWHRLATAWRGRPEILGYDIMNEPHSMPGGATQWEQASQAAVEAIRGAGDTQRIMVAGYHKRDRVAGNGLFTFVLNHPKAWIRDPAGMTRYTTHAYWGHYGYSWTYEESNAWFSRNGSAV